MAAITNYGELKDKIESYLNYGDESVTQNIPLFVEIAIDELNRVLRTPAQETTIFHTVVVDDLVTLPIPINLLELRRIYYGDTYETVDLIDLELFPQAKYTYSDISVDSRPIHFCRDGGVWRLTRPAVMGTTFYITFWVDTPQLVDDTDTNVFLEQTPQALLYRAVAEGHRFLENFPAADYWMQKATEEYLLVQDHADRAENSGSVIMQANNPWS